MKQLHCGLLRGANSLIRVIWLNESFLWLTLQSHSHQLASWKLTSTFFLIKKKKILNFRILQYKGFSESFQWFTHTLTQKRGGYWISFNVGADNRLYKARSSNIKVTRWIKSVAEKKNQRLEVVMLTAGTGGGALTASWKTITKRVRRRRTTTTRHHRTEKQNICATAAAAAWRGRLRPRRRS